MNSRPSSDEYAPYYGRYIDLVPQGDVCTLLEQQIAAFIAVLSAIPEQQTRILHPPHTWTITQVVGHLIDCEKVFGYRAHRFACNDLRPILGMEENEWVSNLQYDRTPLVDLVKELEYARRSNCLLLNRIPAAAWNRTGSADSNTISVRAIAFILVGHVTHHLEIIKRRLSKRGSE